MPVLRLFAAAREAAGVARAELHGTTVGAILSEAERRYGERFSGVLAHSRVWVNGQPAEADTVVQGHDVIAVLPPVSGGSDSDQPWGAKVAPVVEPAGAVGLLEREAEPVAVDLGEPTQAHDVVWVDDSAEFSVVEPPVEEPAWLAEDPPAVDERAPGYYVAPEEESWSGWSTAGGNVETVAPAPEFVPPPEVAAPPSATGFFSPRAPSPPPPAPPPLVLPVDPLVEEAKQKEQRPKVLEGGVRQAVRRLAVVHESKGPHGRLGLLWAIVTVGAAVGGAETLAGWLGLTAFIGACQAAGVRLGQHRALIGLSALIAVAITGAALLGADAVAAAVGGAAVAAFVGALFLSRGSAAHDGIVIFSVGVALGLAAASPVLLREDYIEAAFLLLAFAATYDAGAYLVGTGASSVWEGPVAGVAALIPVVILSAVLLVPPFESGTPILLGLLAALLAPIGPLLGSALVVDGKAHAPGLRRLDSLIVMGPIWAAAAVAFIS